jgi:[ribosomal protein S5]-alanine N-acetyltransferase
MKKNTAILKTQRLLLRPFEDSDIENVFKGLSHPDVIKYYGVSYTILEETKTQMHFFKDLEKNETGQWWAICSLDKHFFYGGCGLNNINKQHRRGEIGYWLLTEFWGKGIIKEALPLVCDYGFKKMNLHRIEAVVETENANSKKVMLNMGFEYEGVMKECEIKNGKYISLEMYAKLNPQQD